MTRYHHSGLQKHVWEQQVDIRQIKLQTLMPISSKVPLRILKELAGELLQLLLLTSMKLYNTGKLLKKLKVRKCCFLCFINTDHVKFYKGDFLWQNN